MTEPRVDRSHAASVVRWLLSPFLPLIIAGVWSVFLPARARAQTAVVQGQVLDSGTREPIEGVLVMLTGTSQSDLTDSRGLFVITGVRSGDHSLRVSHIAYGEKTVDVKVEQGEPTTVRIVISRAAIELEAISVEALTGQELRSRGVGYRQNIVTREQIALAQGTNLTMADVLRQFVPSVRIRRMENIVGTATCIELRTIRTMNARQDCLSPAVYLDGVPITNPTTLYGTLQPDVIERMEVVPAAESGVRYGSGALYGALLIETRRPGAARTQPTRGLRVFDWEQDPQQHPARRAFLYSFIGNAAGLTLGVVAARQCLALRSPAEDSLITKCETWPTVGSAVAAITLPALGGAIGARLGGQTNASRGLLLPASAGAIMALVPGYALAFTSDRENSDVLGIVAAGLLALGVPFLQTVSDRLFRSSR